MLKTISRVDFLGALLFAFAFLLLFFGTSAPVAAQCIDPASGRVIPIPCPQQGQGNPDNNSLPQPKIGDLCIVKPTIDFFIATPNPPTGVSFEWKVSNAQSVNFGFKKTSEQFGGVVSLTGKQDVKFNVQNDTVIATLHAICSPLDAVASLTVSGSEWTQPPKEPDCTNSPVINYFNVSPMTINLGDAVTFNWSVSNAITVWLQYGEHYHGKDFNYGKFDTSPPQVSVLGSSAEPTFQKLKENNKGDTLIGFYYNLFAQCGQFVDGAQRAVALNAPSSAPPQQPPSQNQPPSSQNQPPAQSQPQQPQSQDQSQFQLSLPKVLDPKVLLNEFMPKPKAGAEYIELYNPTNLPVDISGWQLQHAVGNSAQGYVIPANTTIAARAFKLFPQSETKIALNDNGGAVQLLTADNQLADEKSYNAPQFDQAQSRSVDGGGVWTTECAATPNAANCKTTLTQSPSSSPASSSSIENIFPIALVIGAAVIGLALLAAIVIGMKKKK